MAKVLVIDRTKWYRGQGDKESRLLRQDGSMCCLGFDALACGLEPDAIVNRSFPDHVAGPQDYHDARTFRVTREIARINDTTALTDAEREAQLIPLLKQIGGYDDVQFIN